MAAKRSAGKVAKALDPATDSSLGYTISQNISTGLRFRDMGSYGLRQWGGWVREEYLVQLRGLQAQRTYREMQDNSATVGAVLFAIMQSMRQVEWRVESASDTPEAKAEQEFVDTLRHDMSSTWEDFLAEALSMLTYGFAPHEIVYKRRNGRKPPTSEVPSSKFDDGRIGWRRLPIRGQDTIWKWFFDENGQIKGLTQQPWVGAQINIPIEKLLLFRPTAHKNNPEGRSILRNAYRPWYFMKRLEEQEAIMLERMSGVPKVSVPNSLLELAAAGDVNAKATIEAYKAIARNVRIDEQMGLVLPSDTYDTATGKSNVRMYDFELVVPQAGRGAGTAFDTPIKRYQLDILMTVLADFIQLGHAARGTQNLAISKVDMFFQAIAGWMDSISAVLNNYALPRLWDLNGLDFDLMPRLQPDLAQRIDLDALGNFILHLSQAGMPLFPDPDLENWARDAAGMPDISDEAAYAAVRQDGATSPADANPDLVRKMIAASLMRRIRKGR